MGRGGDGMGRGGMDSRAELGEGSDGVGEEVGGESGDPLGEVAGGGEGRGRGKDERANGEKS